jgi:hypothetical protein
MRKTIKIEIETKENSIITLHNQKGNTYSFSTESENGKELQAFLSDSEIGEECKNFFIGAILKIKDSLTSHQFDIGELVTVIEYDKNFDNWRCQKVKSNWYVSEIEAELYHIQKNDMVIWDSGFGYEIGKLDGVGKTYNTLNVTLCTGIVQESSCYPENEIIKFSEAKLKELATKYGYERSFVNSHN